MMVDKDDRVPSWAVSGGAVARGTYTQEAKAYVLVTRADDQKLCGVRLWRCLRGEAKLALQGLDLDVLAERGWPFLKESLEGAIPEGRLRQLPRLPGALPIGAVPRVD